MSKSLRTPPSELWGCPPLSAKAFYLNRGVLRFGQMVENDMAEAESRIRKQHGKKKSSGSADKFVASERLRVLGKHLKEDLKRFREYTGTGTNKANTDKPQDIEQTLGDDFFRLKTK